jgi:hypothetical protein
VVLLSERVAKMVGKAIEFKFWNGISEQFECGTGEVVDVLADGRLRVKFYSFGCSEVIPATQILRVLDRKPWA